MAQASRRTLRLFTAFAVLALLLASRRRVSAMPDDMVVNAEHRPESLDVTGGAVMLELEGEPAAVTYAKARGRGASKEDAGRESKASKQAAEQAQAHVLGSLDAWHRRDAALPGPDRLQRNRGPGRARHDRRARRLPGVKAVHEIPLVELDNHSSVPLIGSLQAGGASATRAPG